MALSTTFMRCAPEATEFGEITQNTNLPPILHRLRDIAFECQKSLYLTTPLAFKIPYGGVTLGRSP